MDKAWEILLTQAPFFGALVVLIVILSARLLAHLKDLDNAHRTTTEQMHREALDRHRKSDDVIEKNSEVIGKVVTVIDKVERKLDGTK